MGDDIDGPPGVSDQSVSLSSDGKILAIGAWRSSPFSSPPSPYSGQVGVYERDETTQTWIQLGGDIVGEAASDQFGKSVSLSDDGKTVAIGAPFNDGNGIDSGHVRVYNYDGSDWIQLGNDIDGEDAGDFSGHSVSLSSDGNTLGK